MTLVSTQAESELKQYRENAMFTLRTIIVAGAAFAVGSTIAAAQWQNSPLMKSFSDNWSSSTSNTLGQLGSNEGIYVDVKDFKVMKGLAKGDPSAEIAKLGARKVSDGAIIFRSGDALYIVDSKPPTATQ